MAKHHCLSCNEPFERPEFLAFLFRLRSKTVNCMRCQTDNFIVTKKNVAWVMLLLISMLFGFIVFLLPNIGFGIATYDELRGTFSIGYIPLLVGGALGLWTARLFMNVFNWMFGSVSQNKKYKSAADFD